MYPPVLFKIRKYLDACSRTSFPTFLSVAAVCNKFGLSVFAQTYMKYSYSITVNNNEFKRNYDTEILITKVSAIILCGECKKSRTSINIQKICLRENGES